MWRIIQGRRKLDKMKQKYRTYCHYIKTIIYVVYLKNKTIMLKILIAFYQVLNHRKNLFIMNLPIERHNQEFACNSATRTRQFFFCVRIGYSPKSKHNHYKRSHKAFYLVLSLWKIFFLTAVFFIFRKAKSRFSWIFSSSVAEGWNPSEMKAYVHFSAEYVFNALFTSISSYIDHRHLINLIFYVFTLITIHLVLIFYKCIKDWRTNLSIINDSLKRTMEDFRNFLFFRATVTPHHENI